MSHTLSDLLEVQFFFKEVGINDLPYRATLRDN